MSNNVTIWKYPLAITDLQPVPLPVDAEILSVERQGNLLCMGALLDLTQPNISRQIEIIGTGHMFDTAIPREFIGTVVFPVFVWHVFERIQA